MNFGPAQAAALAAGSVLGGFARFFLAGYLYRWLGNAFPWGTLAVNLLGCYLIGIFSAHAVDGTIGAAMRLFLMAGFCGAFTTFSAFMLDADSLVRLSNVPKALLYIGLSVALGYLCLRLGILTTGKTHLS